MPRDQAREASLPSAARRALDRNLAARAALAKMGSITYTDPETGMRITSAGQYRWSVLYNALETDPTTIDYLDAHSEAMEAEIPAARGRKKQEAKDKRYEKKALELDPYLTPAQQRKKYAGKDVWLYHGTSSAILPVILEYGLQPDPERSVHPDTTEGYVYLTALYDGSGRGDASFYARMATTVFGGEPVVLRVIVPFDELEPDDDDADLSSGRFQFRTPASVTQIMEVDGKRLKPNRATHPFRSVEVERLLLDRTSSDQDRARRVQNRYVVAGIDRKGNDWALGTFTDLNQAIDRADRQRTYPRAVVLDVTDGSIVYP